MNNRGFTMIELLAAMVILSLLTMISVPTVLSLLEQNRRTTIISDTKKLISNVEYLVNNNNNNIKRPRAKNDCIVITLAYLDLGNDFKNGPHGEPYDQDNSYVVVKRKAIENNNLSDRYDYYGTLVEKIEGGYYGIFNVSKEKLSTKSDIKKSVGGIEKTNFTNINTAVTANSNALGCNSGFAIYDKDKLEKLKNSGTY